MAHRMNDLVPTHATGAEMSDQPPALAHVTNMAIQAITTSVENKTEMRLHREECTATRLRNETMFTETRQNINLLNSKMDKVSDKMGEKIDGKHTEILNKIGLAEKSQEEKQARSNRALYMIVGTLQGLGAAIPVLVHMMGK